MASESAEEVGIIGLGLMGSAMATRLMAAAIKIIGFDIDGARCIELKNAGGTVVGSACEVARRCRYVLLSLPDSTVVESVVASLAPCRPGLYLIDTSTGSPDRTAALGQHLQASGVTYVEATISGNSDQLRQGDVTILLGGPPAALDECMRLLRMVTPKIVSLGAWGNASRMKLVTNLVLGLNRAALAEGLVLAKALGFDLENALKILRSSAAYSRAMEIKGEKMVREDFSPQAKLSQHLKDVHLILSLAEERQMQLPLSEVHRQLLEAGVAQGMGDLDNSAIIRVLGAMGRNAAHQGDLSASGGGAQRRFSRQNPE